MNVDESRGNFSEGATLGPYRIVRRLGVGGMSVVYEAEHTALGIRRALKIFNMSGECSADFLERFLSEGRLLARLSHPGIVRVYDLGWDDAGGAPWFAMDLVVGQDGEPRTLADVIPGETDETVVAEWFASLCATIGYIHSQGVLHRDIKPGNILIASNGRLVLSDFGISRIVREKLRMDVGAAVTCADAALTGYLGPVIGTSGFVAPEVLRGENATTASDIYSLAVVFFRLLTGVWYDTSLAPGSAATDATGVDSARLLKDLECNWEEILPPMLATDPAARPKDISTLASALRRTDETPCKATHRRRSYGWAIALASCAAIALALAVAMKHWAARQNSLPNFDEIYAIPSNIK